MGNNRIKIDDKITLQLIDERFSVCQITDAGQVDLSLPFTFLSTTDEEISLVCQESLLPCNTIAREDGWRCLKIEGVLDFSLVGIIAKISKLLADAGVPIFVISTFNTDYILVREALLERTLRAIERACGNS